MVSADLPSLSASGHVQATVNGCLGLITLNRPEALNALSLDMVRDLAALLAHWEQHPGIGAVVVQGANRPGKAPAFCAGGDIRFFHRAALAGDPALGDFFTEEYALVHRIHHYPKPYIALMDGIVMGGGMGISQGARLRVVNERSRLAMPEARIGLFPDVGGGWFLGNCPGHVGEWLALSGESLSAGEAIELGLADVYVPAGAWTDLLRDLQHEHQPSAEHVVALIMERAELAPEPLLTPLRPAIDRCFAGADLPAIVRTLEAEAQGQGMPTSPVAAWQAWAHKTLQQLQAASPDALVLSLELVRRARGLGLADELRLERNLVHHAFAPAAHGAHSEAVEGIRALAMDKDHQPRWARGWGAWLGPDAVAPAFEAPWAAQVHPLRALA